MNLRYFTWQQARNDNAWEVPNVGNATDQNPALDIIIEDKEGQEEFEQEPENLVEDDDDTLNNYEDADSSDTISTIHIITKTLDYFQDSSPILDSLRTFLGGMFLN